MNPLWISNKRHVSFFILNNLAIFYNFQILVGVNAQKKRYSFVIFPSKNNAQN